ncbi:hypothetical protein [Roseicella aerolata]|uniref:Uncharacterized protein n=1 Tax=Roseicella aerolata TaxID=2883479 RepID=A0A9X1LDK0_9PROT|nr:hypothetical protein [Roseicella aerolata]MCB4824917.1 hypothetical protein [Roseicella aerolata]
MEAPGAPGFPATWTSSNKGMTGTSLGLPAVDLPTDRTGGRSDCRKRLRWLAWPGWLVEVAAPEEA